MNEVRVINPLDIHIDKKCTHLRRKWWHKLFFWKKYVYAEDSYKFQTIKCNTSDLIEKFNEKQDYLLRDLMINGVLKRNE